MKYLWQNSKDKQMKKQILSRENTHYKELRKLRQKKYRDKTGLFLAEGIKFLDYHPPVEEIIISEGTRMENLFRDIDIVELPRPLFQELSSQENSQGVILLCKQQNNDQKPLGDRVLVLDDIRDPGNLGMILRVADAANYQDIILSRGSVDCYHEKAVRSSMGSIFHVKTRILPQEKLYQNLKEQGFTIYMTALHHITADYREVNWQKKHAVVFGNEGHGLSDKALDLADEILGVPIYGQAESLNVAVCAGIVLYEATNQQA